MKLQYWDFFFFLLQLLWTQNTSLVSNAQLITVLRLKGHIMEEAQGTCSVPFWLCHQEAPGDRLPEGRSPSALYPCLQPYRYWFTMFKVSSHSLPLAWGCSLPPGHRARGAQRQLTGGTPECFNTFKIHIWFGMTIMTSYN